MYKVSEFVIGNSDFSLSEHLMPAECGYVASNHWIFYYDSIECSSIFVFVAFINANTFCRCNLIYKRVWLPWLFSIIFFAFATDTEQNTIYTVMSFINPFHHVKKIIVYLASIDLIFIFSPTLLFLTVAIFYDAKWSELMALFYWQTLCRDFEKKWFSSFKMKEKENGHKTILFNRIVTKHGLLSRDYKQ